jgi:hypothetical protein
MPEQQSFDLGIPEPTGPRRKRKKPPKPPKREVIRKTEEDDLRRILTVGSQVYQTPELEQEAMGTVIGKKGYWVLPHDRIENLIGVEALSEIPLINSHRIRVLISGGQIVFVYPNRLIKPKK